MRRALDLTLTLSSQERGLRKDLTLTLSSEERGMRKDLISSFSWLPFQCDLALAG